APRPISARISNPGMWGPSAMTETHCPRQPALWSREAAVTIISQAHETPATSQGGFMHATKEDTPGGHAPWPGSGGALLLILAAVQFTHVVDFIIMMPLGPRYLRELDIGPPQFSLLVSAYAFSACLSGLLAASLIDRFDRKRSLLVLFAGFTLGTAL